MMKNRYPEKIYVRLSTHDKLQIQELSKKAEISLPTSIRIALRQWLWADKFNINKPQAQLINPQQLEEVC